MLLDLNRLHGLREHVDRRFEPSAFDPQDEEYRVAAPVELSMDVQKAGADVFRVSGRARTRLDLDCSRCVEPFEMAVDVAFDLRYVPLVQNAGEGEVQVGDEDLTVAFYREGLLDLTEMLREQFHLAVPMKPLCKEGCRGLCPDCGANLNTTACGCAPVWEDPRLAPLKSLLKSNKENS